MSTMTVHALELSPELMATIPAEERLFFLGLGFISNELNVLRKLVLLSDLRRNKATKAEKDAQASQSLILMKLFALKACAGYEFLSKQKKNSFYKDYANDSEGGFVKSVATLDKYFGKSDCLLRYLRNKFGGHYDVTEMQNLIAEMPDRNLHLYLCDHQGLSLNFAAEETMFGALATQARDGETIGDVMSRLVDDVDSIAEALTDCAQGANISISKRYFPKGVNLERSPIEIVTLADAQDATIPFFVDFSTMLEK